MIGKFRIVAALIVVAAATMVLALPIALGVKTGLYRCGWMRQTWHRIAARVLGFRIHVRGAMETGRPLLLVANHVSWTDVVVLAATADVSFIARSEVAGWPFFGWLARMQRTVFVERERKRKAGEQAGSIAERLASGDAIVLFAEGTTGDGNALLPFKSTLFGAAAMMLSAGSARTVWIQPVAIAYTRVHGLPMGRGLRPVAAWIGDEDLVPHIGRLLAVGAIDVELHFGEPVAFTSGSNRKETARTVETRVRDMMLAALANPAS
jgi:1-acyl-sn-glycerol-3-phosphate acyltransferase